MAQVERYSWLNEFLDSLERALGFMDLSTLQPTSWRHFQPLIAREWLPWFWRIIEAREKQQVPFADLAKVFEPDLCREHLLFTLEDLKTARWPREKRLAAADFLYQILRAQMPQGDEFGLHGTTRRHAPAEVNEMLLERFTAGTPATAKLLGQLYNGAYNLGAALYLDFYMGKAIENYGPYNLGAGKILVIKDMRYLKPVEIWPDINTPAHRLIWYAVYENVKFATDLIACHTRYEGDPIHGLRQWRLERDGREVTDPGEIATLGSALAEAGKRQWLSLLAMPEPQLLKIAVWIRCYVFKPVCERLGLDWQPTPALLAAVEGKTLAQGWQTWRQPTEEQAYRAYWRNILDPRLDFYPEGSIAVPGP